MHAGLKITAFAAALAATFGTAYGVGKGVDPVVEDPAPARHERHSEASPTPEGGGGHEAEPAGGLQISEGGYTLDLRTPSVTAGKRADLSFVIRDSGGRAVTAYQREHEKELHLIVASRDLVTYRHLHPTRAADGTWSIPVELPRAGGYRVFADFTPAKKGAENLTLGADLAASGSYAPQQPPAPAATVKTDGYEVRLDGALRPGRASELKLKVSKNGRPVTDLQPYLGAYGHLVALRSGDLAYLHVHPNGEPGDGRTKPGPDISFTATAPSSGTYRLFLDFKHEGEVRTAAFTVRTGAAPATADTPSGEHEDDSGHGH
ncbi:hypothetical protein J7F01_28780 [Streptomyces sp. ISL-22]|uniref:Heavy metal-binding domain-containing protein n=1 Tax=Streptomyces curacoi TaxID=146536 RepID=A0A117P5N5_9ACTN|nr:MULTISPECIES: hypothetical protein [Streptomyces]KUM73496.1 hypothetical protein AQI70_22330 [Streptomyces curacoi]MBT2417066.1 hypothetical protein [Streptomyces sp. ISL-24]MBT2436082.1 hypothetical protein [Streptomyces sp. ISL-22]